jgi:hypothetical protein
MGAPGQVRVIVELALGELDAARDDGSVHGHEEDEDAESEDEQRHDITSSRSTMSLDTGDTINVPREWIDGTQSPTKMPAISSPSTKYRYTEKRNDRKPAMRNGSLGRKPGGRPSMIDFMVTPFNK